MRAMGASGAFACGLDQTRDVVERRRKDTTLDQPVLVVVAAAKHAAHTKAVSRPERHLATGVGDQHDGAHVVAHDLQRHAFHHSPGDAENAFHLHPLAVADTGAVL
jgi:hypothetical protein